MARMKLRKWQSEALTAFLKAPGKDFLAVATPGAGKTTFALSAASLLLKDRIVDQVVVVAPTEHLKHQWADAAARFGIPLDPTWKNNSKLAPEYLGVVVTYAQVAADPTRNKNGVEFRKTFVILDEVHHAGDNLSWGSAVREAYQGAVRRLSLSGSPWRSDTNMIPFITYQPQSDGSKESQSDYTYGYGDALRDGVVRAVMFLAYSGNARWRTSDGEDLEARLDGALDKVTTNRAWRTALDPEGEWIGQVLTAADARLTQVREGMPNAGGLVLASNQTHARAYAKRLKAITGEDVTVVLSDEPGASKRIETFSAGSQRWMVAVRMVSEGVDVPRLAVGVYATNSATSLFFTQAIGRFVRARGVGETATLFLPSVPQLLKHASAIEEERNHVLGAPKTSDGLDDDLLARANESRSTRDLDTFTFEALEATGHLDRVIYNGSEYGPSVEDRNHAEIGLLTMPGILDSGDVQSILAERAGGRMLPESLRSIVDDDNLPLHRRILAARQELAQAVSETAVPDQHSARPDPRPAETSRRWSGSRRSHPGPAQGPYQPAPLRWTADCLGDPEGGRPCSAGRSGAGNPLLMRLQFPHLVAALPLAGRDFSWWPPCPSPTRSPGRHAPCTLPLVSTARGVAPPERSSPLPEETSASP